MTARIILRLGGTLGLVWALGACGSDEHPGEDGGDGALDGSNDGSDGAPDGGDGQDGSADGAHGSPDGADGADGSEGCEGDGACGGDTPACVDGTCVECSETNSTRCEANEVCDKSRNECVNELTPFSLNCANLPSDGACEGGPVEVLLAIQDTGYIGMFDPEDGHFLGVFKRNTVPGEVNLDREGEERSGEYVYATQGPDQCIWAVGEDERGVERWNADGSFKDNIIPYDRYYDVQNELIADVHHVAFTRDSVYVASTSGSPEARLMRFDLDALQPDSIAASDRYETVIDDGRIIHSLVVLGDGSLVVARETIGAEDAVERIPADGGPVESLVPNIVPWQVTYAGDGQILTADHDLGGTETAVYQVDALTGMFTAQLAPDDWGGYNIYGVAPLHNGNWLLSGGSGGVSTMDPRLNPEVPPAGQWASVWNDPAASGSNFKMIGRACLSEEFIASRQPDPPVASCDAPAGDDILREDFESGDFTGEGGQRNFRSFFEQVASGVDVSIDAAQGANGSVRSLKIAGGVDGDAASGVIRALPPGLQPSYVSYYLRVAEDDDGVDSGNFALNQPGEEMVAWLYSYNANLRTTTTNNARPITKDAWYLVQLRDFDWQAHTYDLYVDCERFADDVAFASDAAVDLHSIGLFNDSLQGTSWYDDIVIK